MSVGAAGVLGTTGGLTTMEVAEGVVVAVAGAVEVEVEVAVAVEVAVEERGAADVEGAALALGVGALASALADAEGATRAELEADGKGSAVTAVTGAMDDRARPTMVRMRAAPGHPNHATAPRAVSASTT